MSLRLPVRAASDHDDGVISAGHPDILAAIARPDVGLAIWERRIDPGLHRRLARSPAGALPSGHILVALPEIEAGMAMLFAEPPPETESPWQALAADLRELILLYGRIAETPVVDVRLQEIAHDACWRYHRDNVRLRLVTTYLGPGTEIVPARHAAQALAAQRDYAGPRHLLEAGAVALFKGDRAGARAVVHRSPPIRERGIRRLLLVLNAPSAASSAARTTRGPSAAISSSPSGSSRPGGLPGRAG
jgi:hypothetical protein